jgi:hypothetical protein
MTYVSDANPLVAPLPLFRDSHFLVSHKAWLDLRTMFGNARRGFHNGSEVLKAMHERLRGAGWMQ